VIYRDERDHEYMVRESGGKYHVYTRRQHYREPDRAWHVMIRPGFLWSDSPIWPEYALRDWAEFKGLRPVEVKGGDWNK